jgi:hypothetical protein
MLATVGATGATTPGTEREAAARARQNDVRRIGLAAVGEAVGLVGEHRERRLERMGEIAGLGAGAQHHLRVELEQIVEVVDQRLHLGGKSAGQLRRFAGANRTQRAPQPRHRLQAELHLQDRRGDQQGRQQKERQRERHGEGRQHAVDHRGVRADLDA